MLQGLGAPGCARILTSWFAAKERGTYWGMWNIAHNMGGFLAPLLAGTAAKMYGWQWGACLSSSFQQNDINYQNSNKNKSF
jgi:sugar phosphate permease